MHQMPVWGIMIKVKIWQRGVNAVKNLNLLVWLTQLGISVAAPLAGFILLGLWLYSRFQWGTWVIWVGVILGVYSAFMGLRSSVKAMERMAKDEKEEPPVAFNDHI